METDTGNTEGDAAKQNGPVEGQTNEKEQPEVGVLNNTNYLLIMC